MCDQSAASHHTTARYCSDRCQRKGHNATYRFSKTEVATCKNCGQAFEYHPYIRKKVNCSPECDAEDKRWRALKNRSTPLPWADCACGQRYLARRGRTRCIDCVAPKPRRWYMGWCRQCGEPFVDNQPARNYCSRLCCGRAHRHHADARRRAWIKGDGTPKVYRLRIAERDNWRCQLCHRKINRKLKWPHPMSPSLDHILPLSLGGKHEPENVQLAHIRCNSLKGAGGTDQLRLIG
jgi:hypothetical protein